MKVLAINGSARKDGNTAILINTVFEELQNMFVVGSSYWAFGYGQMPGEVQKDKEGLDTMRNLGQNMAYLLKALEERRNG